MSDAQAIRASRAITDILYHAGPGADPSRIVGAAYRQLSALFPVEAGAFITIDPRSWALEPGHLWNCESGARERYFGGYDRLDPFVIEAPCIRRPDRVFRLDDFVDLRAVERSEFGVFMRWARYKNLMAVVPYRRGMPIGVVSVHRRIEDRRDGFDAAEKRIFAWFARHVGNALDRLTLLRSLSEAHPPGVLVLAGGGGLLCHSDFAARALERLPADRQFPVPDAGRPAAFWDTGGAAYRVSAFPPAPGSILLSPGIPAAATARTLPPQVTVSRNAAAAIVTIERLSRDAAARMRLARLPLTRGERQVAEIMLEGGQIKIIAGRLGISTGTVKDHRTAIFRKAGVSGIEALLARLFADDES